MKLPEILKNRQARENLKDKFEVVMAVVVLTSFVYNKYKDHKDPHINITSLDQEK